MSNKKEFYFAAGKDSAVRDGKDSAEVFDRVVNNASRRILGTDLLHRTQDEARSAHITRGMSPEFYETNSRLFKVTVEEVEPHDRTDIRPDRTN